MKSTRWSYGAVLLAMFVLNTASAIPPRKDINPALLYFQAFNVFPELDEAESALLGHDTVGPVSEEDRALAQRFDAPFKLFLRARTIENAVRLGC